jgi:flagellin
MAVINTNLNAVIAQNSARHSEAVTAQSVERLSTGMRINSAKDDAAGLAISTRMTAAIKGLGAALKNASDGISMAQIADGALSNITDVLQRLRELAVQSANGSYNNSDRSFLDSEALGLVAEVGRIGNQSNFNNHKLLDGSYVSKTFQLGYNPSESMLFSGIDNFQASAIGVHKLDTSGGSAMNLYLPSANSAVVSTVAQETNLSITVGGFATVSGVAWAAATGADTIASAINTASNVIGVTATASNSATLNTLSEVGTVSFTLNGSNISAAVTSTNDLSSLVSAINGSTSATKVTATFADPNNKSALTLNTNDGRNIQITGFSVSGGGNATVNFGNRTLTEGSTNSSNKTGVITLTSSKGPISLSGANTTEFASATASSSFSSVQGIDLSTQTSASDALNVIDAALTQVNINRANLGALINRFEASMSSQSNSILNLSSARSRILDADYARETSLLAKSMIIQQAATAMLGQANQMPRLVTLLLK